MNTTSEQAAIEVRIDWENNGVRHRARQHFEKFNFWHDILPRTLALQLPESSGEWISEAFAASELAPPWSAANIHSVKRSALRLTRRTGHALRSMPAAIMRATWPPAPPVSTPATCSRCALSARRWTASASN